MEQPKLKIKFTMLESDCVEEWAAKLDVADDLFQSMTIGHGTSQMDALDAALTNIANVKMGLESKRNLLKLKTK